MNKVRISPEAASAVKAIRILLPRVMLKDRAAALRRLQWLEKKGRGGDEGFVLREVRSLRRTLEISAEERKQREQRLPMVSFPAQLPITGRAEELIQAIREHRVVIIAGETGCGKSTQIPKMCLAAGRGIAGRIACTQPRRIAAITIAHRIAEEMNENLGQSVGYKIRFRDRTSPQAYIKILTDGMLLAETQSDPWLSEYDTLIIDEAHERSLNIDFLLGIIQTLLKKRPELKLIITSATLDTEKFSKAFSGAPVLEVSGRLYPVAVEYRLKDRDRGYVDMAAEAVEYISRRKAPGDILVFMPTEQDILETCQILEGRHYRGTTILPLYARLPGTQQGRVYHARGAKIVVATNVAETSLTIPGIKYVVDTGLARISQYQPETRTNSLPISPISQSSADQRKGRCGRVQEGLCIRLYEEADYTRRPKFTPPELLRANLAEVILRMVSLRLGHPAEFPFIDRPKASHIKDGFNTLAELGAITGKGREYRLTERGGKMAKMPLDPRISRMLLEAERDKVLKEVAVIAAALTIRDPRERPQEKAAQADRMHAPFMDKDSDFFSLLKIWSRYHGDWETLKSQRQKRKFCREHFLSFSRMREWADIHDQILAILKELHIPDTKKDRRDIKTVYGDVHRSILSGYLSNIAVHKEKNFYTAARGREVMIFPGSTLFNKPRGWIVAAEMVRTSRLFARTAAKIEAGWLEELGGSLCRYSHSEPRWDPKRGEVVARERVTLYGLEIVSDRTVGFGRIDPETAHDVFIREALLEGRLGKAYGFFQTNLDLLEKLGRLEEKLRRRDILVNEDALAAFYSHRLPGIYDIRTLEKLIRFKGGDDFLRVTEKDLLKFRPEAEELALFPDRFRIGNRSFQAVYNFAPGEETDGVTLKIPARALAYVAADPLEWGVPGLLREKITALIKGLPKRYRKLLVPVADKVDIIVREMPRTEESLFNVLTAFMRRRFQVNIPAAELQAVDLPRHLKMRLALTDERGLEIRAGRNLERLVTEHLSQPLRAEPSAIRRAREKWERRDVSEWDFGFLPERISVGEVTDIFPGLAPEGDSIQLRLFEDREQALLSHLKGIQALLLRKYEKDLLFMRSYLALPEESQGAALYFGGAAVLEEGLYSALQREVLQVDIRSKDEYAAHESLVGRAFFEMGHRLREAAVLVLNEYADTRKFLQVLEKEAAGRVVILEIIREIRGELDRLVPKNFLEVYGSEKLRHLPRCIEAKKVRAQRAKLSAEKDKNKSAQLIIHLESLQHLEAAITPQSSIEKKRALSEFRWMVEEFRVALFAPELKTSIPVSPKRLIAKRREIEAMV